MRTLISLWRPYVLGVALCAVAWICLASSASNKAEAADKQSAPENAANSEAAATIVVFNQNDKESRSLAQFYASKRGIPRDQVVGINCPTSEEISRQEYDEKVAAPLRELFVKNRWWKMREPAEATPKVEASKIRYVVLMRGMPLQIKAHYGTYEGDSLNGPPPVAVRNEACLDSELAALGLYTRSISGALNNPYYGSTRPFMEAGMAPLHLVCRLDAPNAETVRRMITDAIQVEKTGLRGFTYVDARGLKEGGLAEGDKWLRAAADTSRRSGSPTILDDGEGMYPANYPMRYTAAYYGWYSEQMAGPFLQEDFRFRPGAIAIHIHSFSAITLRHPRRQWCGPLVEAGAAATVGNVYEPFLGLTTQPDLFDARIRAGWNFAESAYCATRVLSWQNTFIGDPLYRPFKAFNARAGSPAEDEWDAFRDGARAWFRQSPKVAMPVLEKAADERKSGIISEGYGLLAIAGNDPDTAVKAFEKARSFYKHPDDILRTTLHEVLQLRLLNRQPAALALCREQIEKYGSSPAIALIRPLEAELAAAEKK